MHHFCDLGCRKCVPFVIWYVELGRELQMFFRGLDEGDDDDHDQGDDQGDDDDDDDEGDNNDNDDGDDDKQ